MKEPTKSRPDNLKNFGGWSVEVSIFNEIWDRLELGESILEFGSGAATRELVKYWKVTSIEQSKKWVNMVPRSNYIFAPLKNGWYHTGPLKELPKYDLVLVDGPFNPVQGRRGLLKHLDMFDLTVPWIFDDINRGLDLEVFNDFCKKTGKLGTIKTGQQKQYGIAI